jgi:hypothetical protein
LKIGQPPRTKNGEYDKHELSVWFDQIYRNQGTTSSDTGTDGSTGGGTTEIVQGGSVTVTNYYNAKRYLRWFGI